MEEKQIDKKAELIKRSAEAGIRILTVAKDKNVNMRLTHLWKDQIGYCLKFLTTTEE